MFERFTDNARAVMQIANRQARQLNHSYIGTEHILLAISEHGMGVAVTVLTSLGIDPSRIPATVLSFVEQGHNGSHGKLPQTTRAKNVIEFAMEEARSLQHRYVGTEHLLIGLLHTDGVAAKALAQLKVDRDTVRKNILEVLDTPDYHKRNDAFARRADSAKYLSVGLIALGFFLGVLTMAIIIGSLL